MRIVGVVYRKDREGPGYGHLNMRDAVIKALETEWLDPRAPNCP